MVERNQVLVTINMSVRQCLIWVLNPARLILMFGIEKVPNRMVLPTTNIYHYIQMIYYV